MARSRLAPLAAFLVLSAASAPSAQTITIAPALPGHDNSLIATTDLSSDGRVVVGQVPINGNAARKQVFRWEVGGDLVGLGFLPGHVDMYDPHVSGDGSVVVGTAYVPGKTSGFRWSGGALQALPVWELDDPNAPNPVENESQIVGGLSANGAVAAGWGDHSYLLRWTGGEAVRVGTDQEPWFNLFAHGVSSDGSVIIATTSPRTDAGGTFWSSSPDLYRVVGTSISSMPFLPGTDRANPIALSDDGSTAVGWSAPEHPNGPWWDRITPTVWGPDGVRALAVPDSVTGAMPVAVSADGSVVVGDYRTEAEFGGGGAIWRDGVFSVLRTELEAAGADLDGLFIISLNAVSADGTQVAGTLYVEATDQVRAFHAELGGPFSYAVTTSPSRVNVGSEFEVRVAVSNQTTGSIDNVRPTSPVQPVSFDGGDAQLLSGPTPATLGTLAPGRADTLLYRFQATAEGTITFEVDLEGVDASGAAVMAAPLCTASSARRTNAPCGVEVGGLGFTAESAFMKADSLFWPDTTYTLRWTPGGAETIEIHGSLLRDPDPANDAHWPLVVATGLEAASGSLEWTVPVETTSPTVRLRIRDEADLEVVDVSERARVRYGWHLTRIATDPSGEMRYEAFDPARHGWREDAPAALDAWIDGYYTDMMLGVRDPAASRDLGETVETGLELDYLLGERAGAYTYGTLRPRGNTRAFSSLREYLEKRRDNAPRTLPTRAFRGTPSWTSVAFAFGDQTLYGQPSPVLVPGFSETGPSMSQVHPGIAFDYAAGTVGTGKGMCYGLSWSALLMFQDPDAFVDWYRPLHPTLAPVRELRDIALDADALEVIGAVFTTQARSGSANRPGTVQELQASLASDEVDDDRILSNRDHAVLPYRVEVVGPETVQVRVHDRTLPGQDGSGEVTVFNVVDDTLRRPGHSRVYGFTVEEYGDFLKPVGLSSTMAGTTPTVRVGPGSLVETFLGSSRRRSVPEPITVYRNDPDLPPLGYTVPEGPFTFTVRPDESGPSFATVTTTRGTAYHVAFPDPSAGADSLAVTDEGLTVLGRGVDRRARLGLTAESIAGTRRVEISSLTVGDGQSVTAGWTVDGVRLANRAASQTYDLTLLSTAGAVSSFSATSIALEAGAIHTVRPDWSDLEGGDVTIEVDDDGDGTPDRTITVARATPAEDGPQALPTQLALDAPFPNPATSRTTIPVSLPEAGRVRLSVLDALGREVLVLEDGERSAGDLEAVLDAGRLAPGVYVLVLEAGGAVRSRTLTVVR